MFQRASNGALLTLDLHSWSDDCEAACEVLRPCEAAAAAEAYFTVIKNSFGKRHACIRPGPNLELLNCKRLYSAR